MKERFMKFFLATLILFASTAMAQQPRALNYKVGDCKVSVKIDESGLHEFRVDDDTNHSYAKFWLDPKSGKLVGGLNTCNSRRLKTTSAAMYRSDAGSKEVDYIARCGGKNERQDYVMELMFNKKTGKISYIVLDGSVIGSKPVSTMFGVHMPTKTKVEDLFCTGNDLSTKITRAAIEQRLYTAEKTNTLVSFLSKDDYRKLQPAETSARVPASAAEAPAASIYLDIGEEEQFSVPSR
jgi:hypothetical protein